MAAVELQRQADSPTLVVVVALRNNAVEERIAEDIVAIKYLATVDGCARWYWREAGANAELRSFFAKTSSRPVNLQISPRRTPSISYSMH